MDTPSKKCITCNRLFYKRKTCSKKSWEASSYCSRKCVNVNRRCPWKGKKLGWEIWNKNKKGVQVAWNKGIHYAQISSEKNYGWKGNDASLVAKHAWVVRRLGRPRCCAMCGDTTRKMYHWSNISGRYLRDVNDYERLCVPCHKQKDLLRLKAINQSNERRK